MKCINCGKEIPENSKFCMECGTSVVQKEITCKKCGQALPAGAKFCSNCGVSTEVFEASLLSKNDKGFPIVLKLKKQMLGGMPVDIYIDDEFVDTLRSGGDFINYNLAAEKATSEIKIRIVMMYLFKNSCSLYITLNLNEREPKSITIFQNFSTNKPDVEIVGFDVISRTLSGNEKYSSPKTY